MSVKRFSSNIHGDLNGIYNILDNRMPLDHNEIVDLLNSLSYENEQLQARNDRQAKQLDNLYRLIEEKDWRALTDIMDDFKECEEQLQREWMCYE